MFGEYIKIFYLGKQANRRKMESGRYPRWALVSVPTSVTFLVVSYFPNFRYIPKWTKNIFADFLESVYLPYHVPPLFHDSGVFQKVSFICSSGVIVWIILLSTLMGVPEI